MPTVTMSWQKRECPLAPPLTGVRLMTEDAVSPVRLKMVMLDELEPDSSTED